MNGRIRKLYEQLLRRYTERKEIDNFYCASSWTRQCINWTIVIVLQLVLSSGDSMLLPSMHQFITNPRESVVEITKDNQSLHILPGLGASEYIYSWIVTTYAIGEITGAAIALLLTALLPYHVTFPIGSFIHLIGGVIYALAVHIAMMFTARFLMGFAGGILLALTGGYLGVSADNLEATSLNEMLKKEEKLEKDTATDSDKRCLKKDKYHCKRKRRWLKELVFITYGLIKSILVTLTLGIASVMSLFSRVHQFRWAGWFAASLAAGYIVAFLIVFEKPHQGKNKHSKAVSTGRQHKTNPDKRQRKLHPVVPNTKYRTLKQIVVYSFFLFAAYAAGAQFTVMDTLLNPILQDQFSFTIVNISVFLLITLVLPILATMLVLVIKALSIDDRVVFAGLLLMAIAGGVTMSDWQAIGNDPCSIVLQYNRECNSSSSAKNTTCSEEPETLSFNPFLNLSVSEIEDLCVNGSTPENTCYWNPRSRITGKYCSDCTQRCSSNQKSLHFVQLSIGITLYIFVLHIIPLFVNIIAFDYTPTENQGIVTGTIFTIAGFARIVSPLWSDWAYEATNKHTYVVMTINSSIMAILLLLLLILYKYIGPKSPIKTSTRGYKYGKASRNDSKELLQAEESLIPSDSEEYTTNN